MKRYSTEVNCLIVFLYKKGFSYQSTAKEIKRQLGLTCTRQGVRKAVIKYKSHGHLLSAPRKCNRRKKLTSLHKKFIQAWQTSCRDLTSAAIKNKLLMTFGVNVSTRLIRKVRYQLGWTVKTKAYCQLISVKNCLRREQWCLHVLSTRDPFEDVVFMDETTVEMSSHGRIFLYKKGPTIDNLPMKAPKPKHSYKVHVWGGISYRGRTDCCVFTGIMDSVIYQKILERNLLPFVRYVFPDGFRLYQDNDSKHCSKSTQQWMIQNNISKSVMEVPASSPDLNPIENVWAALKHYLQTTVKPQKKDELVSGIAEFWNSLTAEQCGRYIDHIHKVIPEVVLNKGGPTVY